MLLDVQDCVRVGRRRVCSAEVDRPLVWVWPWEPRLFTEQ